MSLLSPSQPAAVCALLLLIIGPAISTVPPSLFRMQKVLDGYAQLACLWGGEAVLAPCTQYSYADLSNYQLDIFYIHAGDCGYLGDYFTTSPFYGWAAENATRFLHGLKEAVADFMYAQCAIDAACQRSLTSGAESKKNIDAYLTGQVNVLLSRIKANPANILCAYYGDSLAASLGQIAKAGDIYNELYLQWLPYIGSGFNLTAYGKLRSFSDLLGSSVPAIIERTAYALMFVGTQDSISSSQPPAWEQAAARPVIAGNGNHTLQSGRSQERQRAAASLPAGASSVDLMFVDGLLVGSTEILGQCASGAVLVGGLAALADVYARRYATEAERLAGVVPTAISWAMGIMVTGCKCSNACQVGVDWGGVGGTRLVSALQALKPLNFAANMYCAGAQLANDTYTGTINCCNVWGYSSPVCLAGAGFGEFPPLSGHWC